jgi:hypothetical protein
MDCRRVMRGRRAEVVVVVAGGWDRPNESPGSVVEVRGYVAYGQTENVDQFSSDPLLPPPPPRSAF